MSTSNPNPSDTSTSTDLEQDVPTQYRDVESEFVEVGTAHMPANGFHAFHPLLNEPPSALSRDLKPVTSATLTVRIIKSFRVPDVQGAGIAGSELGDHDSMGADGIGAGP